MLCLLCIAMHGEEAIVPPKAHLELKLRNLGVLAQRLQE